MRDRNTVLVNAQEGRTKAMRQWRMTSAKEVDAPILKKYVDEAVALAKAGKSVAKSPAKKLVMPDELKKALTKNKKVGAVYKALTPGRQREYADYVNEAKREETRAKRVEKILPMIAAGAGLNDKYRNC